MKVLIMNLEGMHGDYEEQPPRANAAPGFVAKRPYRNGNKEDIEKALGLGYKVVLMIRDGRDVMVSRHPSKPEEYYIKDSWVWVHAYEYYKQFMFHHDVEVIYYEQLVSNPNDNMGLVIKLLGLNREPSAAGALAQAPPGTTLHQAMRGQQTITTAKVGQWKNDDGGMMDALRHDVILWCAFSEALRGLGYVGG
jgi:hypothetical protein